MIKVTPAYLLLVAFLSILTFSITVSPLYSAAHAQELPTTATDVTPLAVAWESTLLPSGITPATVKTLAVDPGNANIAYLATHKGLFKTTDAGQNWQRLGAGLLEYMFDLSISAANAQRIYAQSWQLYRSDDGGATWVKLSPPGEQCGITAAPTDADLLYVRCRKNDKTTVSRSLDGGHTWITPQGKVDQALDWFAVAPQDPAILIGANFDHAYRSSDSGESWTPLPIGTRFAGRPLFDLANPSTVYFGHWVGLLRSTDAGAAWLDSGADREITTLIMAPDNKALLAGNKTAAWRFVMDGKGWSATAWEAPPGLLALWRGVGDAQLIYALSEAGLWRQRQEPPPIFTPAAWVYLPVVQRGKVRQQTSELTAASIDAPLAGAADQAIARANEYRQWVGAVPLQAHDALNTAAQKHADYHMANHADPSAWPQGSHSELPGKPHFSGKDPHERAKNAGFPWSAGVEVMHFIGDPLVSVDGWMATVYHRLLVIDPGVHYVGYGMGKDESTKQQVDVMDFGGGPTATGLWSPATPHPLAYPANGQTGVPISWEGGEWPNPLPPGTKGPVGYPFTLQPIGGKLQVDQAQLRTAAGEAVAVYPSPADCAQNGHCYTLIAVAPLQPNTEYVVDATGNVGGFPFQQQWRFTTGDSSVLAAAAPPELSHGSVSQ